MPIFIAALLGGLANMAGTLVGRVLIALGLSITTFTGLSTTLDWVKQRAVTGIMGLPPEVVQIVSSLGVGQFLSIIASAISARWLLNGLTDGTIKRWAMK